MLLFNIALIYFDFKVSFDCNSSDVYAAIDYIK